MEAYHLYSCELLFRRFNEDVTIFVQNSVSSVADVAHDIVNNNNNNVLIVVQVNRGMMMMILRGKSMYIMNQ